MPFSVVTSSSRAGQLQAVRAALAEAAAAGQVACLLLGSVAAASARKVQLAGCAGVGVQALEHWVSGSFDVYGDGRRVISGPQRLALVEAALLEHSGALPSSQAVRELAALVTQLAAGQAEGEEPVVRFVRQVLAAEEARGLIEPSAALAQLAQNSFATCRFVVEDFALLPAWAQEGLRALAQNNELVAVEQELALGVEREQEGRAAELAALSSALFSGADAGEPAGVVQFAEAHGHHAQALTLVRLVQHFLQRGVAAHNIALVVPGASFLSEEMLCELAQAEIPFSCNLTVPLEHTELGLGLLLALCTAKGLLADGAVVVDEGTISCPPPAGHADNSYAPLAALLSCRACGLAEIDSRALRLRWRKRGQSCAQARMQDLTRGIRRNMSKASTAAWQNATEPLRLLLVQAIRTVQSSFENEQLERLLDLLVANVAKAGQLDDALAAAGTVRAHTDLYRALGLLISLQKLERMQVSLSRSFGVKTAGEGLKVLTASEATSAQFEVAILCGLSADYFPMVGRPSVFKGVLEAHGVFESDHTALLQRRNLLNIIDGCSQGFGAWRAAHDAGADELRQSALWDELLEVYAEPPVMRVSEDERFAQCAQEGSGVPATWRTQAKLMRESSISDLLMPNFELNEIFSPTALEAYVQCPYGWFTSRRLGILEYDRGFDAALQGNIAHDSFERFYRQLQAAGHKRVTPENLPMAQELIAGAVDETVAAYKARGALYLHSHKEEQDIARIRQQLVKFVERDAQFLPGFTPRYCELRLGYEQEEHPLEYAGVRVRGKVDRIDVSEDGTQAVIVDYKMSKLATGYGLTDKQNTPTRIQTDIYATLVERHFVQLGTPLRVVGSVYRSYSANVLRGVYSSGIEWGGLEGLNKNDAVPRHNDKQPELSVEKYPVYLQRIEALVAQRMEELKAGNISAAPITKDACKYCKAAHVCQKRRG